MNFLGFAFTLVLLVAVQLTTFTWAATNVTKTSGKGKKAFPLFPIPFAHVNCVHWIKRCSRIGALGLLWLKRERACKVCLRHPQNLFYAEFFSQFQTLQFFIRHTLKVAGYFYIFANIEQAYSSGGFCVGC